MAAKVHTIEVDETTAQTLETRAAALGVSVATLVAELAGDEASVQELDARWRDNEGGQTTIPHDRVVEWLGTWGSARFGSWNHR